MIMGLKSTLAAMTLKAKVVIVCAAVAVTGGTAAGVGIAMTREETYRVLKVFELTGTAIVERDGSGELDAYTGMNLESGDTLTVNDGSSIRISLDDDKYILLDEGTVMELTATGTASDSRTAIDLKQGMILNEITEPLSANSSYEVATPKATMAVRGTSFTVSVEKDKNGGYMIREDTFHGKVEVELIDSKGNKTGKKVLIPSGKGVSVYTEPDETTGNPAEVDGFSKYVTEDGNGGFSVINDGDDPARGIYYGLVPPKVKDELLSLNDRDIMLLDEDILDGLRGNKPTETSAETTAATTSATSQTTVTTVPETSETEEETTLTAAPVTSTQTTSSTTGTTTEKYVPSTRPTSDSTTTVTTTEKTKKKTAKTTTTAATKKTTETADVTTAETTVTTTEETTTATAETTTTTTAATTVPTSGDEFIKLTTGESTTTTRETEKTAPTDPTPHPTDFPEPWKT